MEPRDVEAYLQRIGYGGAREPTPATLRALQRAHMATEPIANLDIHAGRAIHLDRRAFFRKIVGERRGGFCYELNGLFGDLLESLGFEVALLSARVARDAGGFGPEYDHLALLTTCQGRWLADVGFGRSFAEPLSLDAPVENEAEGLFYRATSHDGQWRVESRRADGAPQPEYSFSLIPRRLEEFAGMCAYHQTSADSHFTQRIVCSRPTARGRITIAGRTLVITEGETRRETLLDDDGAVAAALAEHFAIEQLAR